MALSYSFVTTTARPSRQTLELHKRHMELMGLGETINGPTSVEELKDLVSDRWRRPHKPCDEVYPKIFVGGEKAARDLDLLKNLGITHIINVASTEVSIKDMFYIQGGHKCMTCNIPAVDLSTFSMRPYFDEANRFIEVAILTGGKVLIHCRDGVSRSATIVIAYLMMRKNLSALEAVKTVRGRRMVLPNDGFLAQIVELDAKLRKNKII